MAGFWASQGVFRLRTDDERVGRFLALAAGIGAAAIAMLVIRQTIGLTFDFEDLGSQTRFVTLGLIIVAIGVAVAWITGRSVFAFEPNDPRIHPYLSAATAISAFALLFALFRLLFTPGGYFSSIDGVTDDGAPDDFLGGANLTSLAMPDPLGLIVAIVVAAIVGFLVWTWARRGENARLFPVWVGGLTTGIVAAVISAPIAAGVFGGVTGAGTDILVSAVPRARVGRVPVGLRTGPDERPARQDDQLHDRLLHPRGASDHRCARCSAAARRRSAPDVRRGRIGRLTADRTGCPRQPVTTCPATAGSIDGIR